MKIIMLFCLILTVPLTAFSQIGSVPGTLNQIQPDPEQKNFEAEYDKLIDCIKDLEGHKANEKSSCQSQHQEEEVEQLAPAPDQI